MKKLILALLILTSCQREGIKTEQTNNKEFDVTLLFEKDGCKVYRFYDGGYYRYFTTCKGSIQWEESCGKNCTNPMEITTN